MAERIRFYMDEHVPAAISQGLRRRGVDVLTTQDAEMRSANDDEQLAFALSQGRVVFTQDADFLRLHAAGARHAGIVYAQQGASIGAVIRKLMLIVEALDLDDMTDHLEFV